MVDDDEMSSPLRFFSNQKSLSSRNALLILSLFLSPLPPTHPYVPFFAVPIFIQPFSLSDYVNTTLGDKVSLERRRGNLHLFGLFGLMMGSKAVFRMRQQALDMNVNRNESLWSKHVF